MTTPDPTPSSATATAAKAIAAETTTEAEAEAAAAATTKTKRKRTPSSSTSKRKKKQPSGGSAAAGETKASQGGKKGGSRTKPTKAKRGKPPTTPVPSAVLSSSTTTAVPPPTHTLIIDNGGHTLKYGFVDSSQSQSILPHIMPNMTGRLRHQITVLKGDEIDQVQPNQLQITTRSMERGCITNMGNQIQVWKRLLDNLNIVNGINLNGEASQTYGWKMSLSKKLKLSCKKKGSGGGGSTTGAAGDAAGDAPSISTKDCAVLLLIPPHYPRVLLEQILQVWFEDFGVSHVGFALSAVTACVAATSPATSKQMIMMTKKNTDDDDDSKQQQQHEEKRNNKADTGCCCMVDAGWSGISIVPTFQNKPLMATTREQGGTASTTTAIRRIPLGGKHLTNILKYHVSYRQWNLMDQEWILQDVMEKLSYFSLNFQQDMRVARKLPKGQRPWDRDYVLPDMQTTFEGQVRLTPQLLYMQQQEEEKQQQQEKSDEQKQHEEEEELDEDYQEGDDDDDDGDGSENDDDGNNNSDNDGDDEEETDAQIRRRVMRQRQEEEQRRKEIEAEQQILNISIERFATPEVLFHPSDVGLPTNMAGLAHGVVQSIQACPKKYHAALYGNVVVTGGISQITNFQIRLEQELRSLTPYQYPIHISVMDSPITQSWMGAREWMCSGGVGGAGSSRSSGGQTQNHSKWSINHDEWEQSKKDPKKRKLCLSRLLNNTSGILV